MHEHTDYSMKTNIYFYAFLNLLWYLGKQHSHKTCLLLKKKKMNLQSVPQSGENTGSKAPIRYHRKLIFTVKQELKLN